MALLQQHGDTHRGRIPVRREGADRRTNRLDAQGLLFEAEFQPGSGSWDFLLGGAFTQRFGAWSFDANVLGIIAGRGTQDTNLGSRLLYNAAVSYRLVGYTPPEQHSTPACRPPRSRTGRYRTGISIRSKRSRRRRHRNGPSTRSWN